MKRIFFVSLYALIISFIVGCTENEPAEKEVSESRKTSDLTKTRSGVIDENTDLESKSLNYEVKVIELKDKLCTSNDESCSKIYLEYPEFIGTGSAQANIISNRRISEFVGVSRPDNTSLMDLNVTAQKFIDAYHELNIEESFSNPWYAETKVIGHNYVDGALSIKINTLYDLGTADPSIELWAINFNEKTGEELYVIDHITDLESFLMLCENEFRNHFEYFNNQNLNSKGFTFELDQFLLPRQYALTSDGLELIYNAGEIAPQSKGVISFIIPYNSIGGLMDLTKNQNPYQ